MAKSKAAITWTKEYVESLAPDEASIPAARKVLTKGGFGTVDPTADNRGWWVVCQGITDTYHVSVQREGSRFECRCNCPSPKIPCKHALALLLHLVEHPELRTEAETPKTAALDFESLVRAAFAQPEDDTHRLVLADYLEENDQPDRAALIRYQCEQARLPPNARRRKELAKLIDPLSVKLREHIGPFPDGIQYEFRRGFMRLDLRQMAHFTTLGSVPARIINLFHDGWVESLVALIGFGFDTDVMPLVGQIGELDLSSQQRTDEALIDLLTMTTDARTTGRLARVTVHRSNRKAFDRMLRFQRGERVDLSADLDPVRQYYNPSAQTFNQLLQFGRFNGARDLYLRSDKLGEAEVTALLTADLSALRHLRLYGWKFTRAAMEVLVNSPALAKLMALSLQSCSVQGPSVAALVRSPLFAKLRTIDLLGNNIGKQGVEALMKAKVPPALRKLALSARWIDVSDRKRLKNKYGTKVRV